MSVTTRRATVGDLDALYDIERECFSAEAFTKEQIAYLLRASTGVSLVARIDHEITGFIISLISQCGRTRVGHVYTIDVLTRHRRKGVASKLLGELERALVRGGVKTCYLEARVNNVAARELYKKHGYVEVEQLKDYYGKGVYGVRLKKDLF